MPFPPQHACEKKAYETKIARFLSFFENIVYFKLM